MDFVKDELEIEFEKKNEKDELAILFVNSTEKEVA